MKVKNGECLYEGGNKNVNKISCQFGDEFYFFISFWNEGIGWCWKVSWFDWQKIMKAGDVYSNLAWRSLQFHLTTMSTSRYDHSVLILRPLNLTLRPFQSHLTATLTLLYYQSAWLHDHSNLALRLPQSYLTTNSVLPYDYINLSWRPFQPFCTTNPTLPYGSPA